MSQILNKLPQRWLTLAGQLLNAFIGFFSISVLTRKLTVDDFGSWVIYLTIFGVLELLRTGLIYQALVTFVNKNQQKADSFIIAAHQLNFLLGFGISILFAILVVMFKPTQISSQLWQALCWYPVVGILIGPYYMKLWLSQAIEQYFPFWLFQFLPSTALLLYLFTAHQISLGGVIAVHATSRVAIALFLIFKSKWKTAMLFQLKTDEIKTMLNFSQFTMVSTMASQLLKSSDIFLINHFLGPSMVAIYQIPAKLIEIAEIPLRGWMVGTYSKLVKQVSQNSMLSFTRHLKKEVLLLSSLALGVSIIGLLSADWAIVFFAGEDFFSSIRIFQVFLIYLLFLPADRYIGVALDALGLPHLNSVKVILMLIINLVGDYYILSNNMNLAWVPAITVLNIASGLGFGLFQLHKKLSSPKTPSLVF